MSDSPDILIINFGSTSTKIGIFKGEEEVVTKSYNHGEDGYPKKFADLVEHRAFAEGLIETFVKDHGFRLEDFDLFVARGGAQVFIKSGAYLINDIMYADTLRIGGDRHPGKLGTQIAYGYSEKFGKPAYIVNGPSVDEFIDVARPTGLKGIYRQSRIHTLNQKEVAYRYAKDNNLDYRKLNLIVCHMGGGISVTAHEQGLMIDSNDIIEGEGPFSPTRSGAMPVMPLLELAYSGEYDFEQLVVKNVAKGGLIDHLGTADLREVESKIAAGDSYAKVIFEAMVYQIAKQAGAMAVSLKGKVDAILFTGGMAKSTLLCSQLKEWLSWIAPITEYPGEFELQGLASGIIRALDGTEEVYEYTGVDVWSGFDEE